MNNQEQKDLRWNELLLLLDIDPEWFKKPDTERYKQITRLGRQIYEQSDKSNGNKIDEQKYRTLISYGFTLKQIATEFQVSEYTLFNWRKDKGYIKTIKRRNYNEKVN